LIELRPMTPEFLEAALDGRTEEAARLIGAELPEDFLRERGRRFFAMRLKQMRSDARFLQWCPHVVVAEGRMIGHAGYHGPPGVNANNDETAVEIGYVIEPPFRGQGHATAAAAELMRLAEDRGVRHYIASVSPNNDPSLAIVRKLGFVQTGERMDDEDGLELVFELERPVASALDEEVQG
jgi:RimJ/RimL family protein N-acetyltransferase